MKKAIFFCTLLMTCLGVQTLSAAMLTDVPENVTKAFMAKFPKAQDVIWDNYEDTFIASFDENGRYTEVTFDAKGNWVESNATISEEDLPATVTEMIQKQYPTMEYYNSVRYLDSPKTGEQLMVSFDTETQSVNLTFSKDGQLLNKEVEDF